MCFFLHGYPTASVVDTKTHGFPRLRTTSPGPSATTPEIAPQGMQKGPHLKVQSASHLKLRRMAKVTGTHARSCYMMLYDANHLMVENGWWWLLMVGNDMSKRLDHYLQSKNINMCSQGIRLLQLIVTHNCTKVYVMYLYGSRVLSEGITNRGSPPVSSIRNHHHSLSIMSWTIGKNDKSC